MTIRIAAVGLLLSAAAITGFRSHPGSGANLAADVTIYRDRYGVPHVVGKTDAATAFGFGYSQAEDNFARLEDNYIRAAGRLAEVEGESAVGSDHLNRVLEIPRLAREEYRRLDPRMKALVEGFVAGINFYLEKHSAVKPRLLTRMEPWYPLAFIRYNYYQNGFAGAAGIRRSELILALNDDHELARHTGSNGWVVNPSRSASGHALLFINPHLPFFGPGQVYEGHVLSEEGWNFTGYTRFGFPLPYVGHNESVGWVSTDNAADQADSYLETFDDPARPLAYRYGSGYRMATEWTDTIFVKRIDGLTPKIVTLRKTHHGPVVGKRGDKLLSLRMAKFEADGWLREWYQMTRARNLREFKAAMRPLNMQFGNAMYADRDGNTFYLYNGAVPRRDPAFDWRDAVDGSDPRTEWQGYHALDELPQLTNPPSGWMQNCNGTPFLLSDRGNPDPAQFPSYMVTEPDTRRAMVSRKILAGKERWTFEEWTRAGFDTYVVSTDSLLPLLLLAFDALPPSDPTRARLESAVDTMRRWDHRAASASVATALFTEWRGQFEERFPRAPLTALDSAIASITRRHGTWLSGWGETNRLQRFADPGGFPSDTGHSIAVPGVPGNDGAVFTVYAAGGPNNKRRYGVAGATYVSVVEFGPQVRARTIHVFGASGDPKSSHFFDQAPIYAQGRFKPGWFTLEEIKANLEASYRPGDR